MFSKITVCVGLSYFSPQNLDNKLFMYQPGWMIRYHYCHFCQGGTTFYISPSKAFAEGVVERLFYIYQEEQDYCWIYWAKKAQWWWALSLTLMLSPLLLAHSQTTLTIWFEAHKYQQKIKKYFLKFSKINCWGSWSTTRRIMLSARVEKAGGSW